MREQSTIEGAGSNPGPSTQRHKRARSPESEGSDDDDDDDDEYLPRKRARVSRSSSRSIQAVRELSIYVITELNRYVDAFNVTHGRYNSRPTPALPATSH